ncbi:MAG: NADH-quinone oxidoreductase subunit I [Acidobacteriota bacterium]
MIVPRRKITLPERLYFPEIFRGMSVTLKHLFKKKVTIQYPEERWILPEYYRGAPALVTDQFGRRKCVACYLCQYVCPANCISIEAGELPSDNKVEKYPVSFEINYLRCIFCGFCEEACPEQAIFMTRHWEFAPTSRQEMLMDKEALYRLGGERHDPVLKWANK